MSGRNHLKETCPTGLKSLGIGILLGLVTCSLLLIILAFIFTNSSSTPYYLVEPMMIFSAGMGAFTGGYFTAKKTKENGMMYGMACAFIMFLFIFIAGLIVVRQSLTVTTLIRLILMLLFGATGGIIGVNKRTKNR